MYERTALLRKEMFVMLGIVFIFGGADAQKMKLQDLQAITLHEGKMAASRRSPQPVPQLMCLGGSAGCMSYKPRAVLCKNEGWDGHSIQWECKADMPAKYSFGEISVICEGYDYPNDPYILIGSCSLEYTMEYAQQGYGTNSRSSTYKETRKSENSSNWTGTYIIVGLLVLGYIIYSRFLSDDTTSTRTDRPSGGPDYGWNVPSSGGSDDSYKGFSPPPFGSSRGAFNQYGYGGYHAQQGLGGGGGGFWTGMATGGVLGYLFGNRQSEPRASSHYTPHSSFQRMSDSTEDDSSTMRTSTAYGGTKRR